MSDIGILFAGGVVIIVVMAFISMYFPPKNTQTNNSITIHGVGSGVDVVDKIVNKHES